MDKTRKCPACHGQGGETDVILDDGSGPWEKCGYCDGTGQVKGNWYYSVLGFISADKRFQRQVMQDLATLTKGVTPC